MDKATVIGVGNILLSDEGLGVRAVERLISLYDIPPNLSVIDGGTMGLDLLPFIEGVSFLLIIDALKGNKPPGSISILRGEEVPAFLGVRLSPHQIGIQELLATSRLLGIEPEKTVIIGVEPKEMGVGLSLSKEIEMRLDEVVNLAVNELKENGFEPIIKNNVPCDTL